jgi:hypothetical protein
MSAELRQLWEQRDALDALAEALRTRDGWLAYRAGALREQLLELVGQPTPRASDVERVRTALIYWDGALQQTREDLERVLTVYFGAPSMFITLWFGFDYGTNPPLGTLII